MDWTRFHGVLVCSVVLDVVQQFRPLETGIRPLKSRALVCTTERIFNSAE